MFCHVYDQPIARFTCLLASSHLSAAASGLYDLSNASAAETNRCVGGDSERREGATNLFLFCHALSAATYEPKCLYALANAFLLNIATFKPASRVDVWSTIQFAIQANWRRASGERIMILAMLRGSVRNSRIRRGRSR